MTLKRDREWKTPDTRHGGRCHRGNSTAGGSVYRNVSSGVSQNKTVSRKSLETKSGLTETQSLDSFSMYTFSS